jgi:hypothetical protein
MRGEKRNMATKKPEVISKSLFYLFDPEETYTYNVHHGTEYPYHKFPKGAEGQTYKPTRFINWQPIPEDVIMRYFGAQIIVNFQALFPDTDPAFQIFQLRSKRPEIQNLICEQINFFTALYDPDNELITNMLIAKYKTDSQTYTIKTFDEFYQDIYDTLFSSQMMDKIEKMVSENNVGDNVVGLFPVDFTHDMYKVSFMIKIMHIYVEHFILSTGNVPKDLYELFAKAFTHIMNQINPNMYILLYNYANTKVLQTIASNQAIYEMRAIDGVTAPTTTQHLMRKTLICDGLIKLTFASEWDAVQKRPTYSCVGLIKSIVARYTNNTRKMQMRYSLVNVDGDISQLLADNVGSNAPISVLRSFNPGEYCCMFKDLNIIIGQIILEIDISSVDWYLENLIQMNDLSKILVDTVLYNKFHSSLTTNTLSMKQKYIILLYVRNMVMDIYNLSEEDTVDNPLINIIMGKVINSSTKTLTPKDLNGVKKYVKLNNLREYLLSEKNVNVYVEKIIQCVLSNYTIVNHNDPSLLNSPLLYDSGDMTIKLLDMIVSLFERMRI